MCIEDAIHNAKIDGSWIDASDKGKKECIVKFNSMYKNRYIDDQTSFDLNVENAEEELKELWNTLYKELGAVSHEAVKLVYILR